LCPKDDDGLYDEEKGFLTLPNGEKIPCPPGYDILKNMEEASHMSLWEFYKAVKSGGKWDYKTQGHENKEITHPEYEALGNVNYGATGKAVGVPETVLLYEAGRVQEGDNPGCSSPVPLIPIGIPPYNDEPKDVVNIKEGFEIYDESVIINYNFSLLNLLLVGNPIIEEKEFSP